MNIQSTLYVNKTNFRWVIVALLFFATTINYFDRFLMGILAPILIPVIIASLGSWKWVFILSGFLGVFWLLFWLILYKKPRQSRFANQAEIDFIEDGEPDIQNKHVSLVKLLKYRQTWAVSLGKLFAYPV